MRAIHAGTHDAACMWQTCLTSMWLRYAQGPAAAVQSAGPAGGAD